MVPHSLRRLAPLAFSLVLATACINRATQAPEQTAVMDDFGVEDVNSRKVRLASEHALDFYLRLIEVRADSILSVSADPRVSTNALAWKANAVPALQRAVFHSDPLIGYTDGWVLVELMEDFFSPGGRGSDWFDEHQHIARNALREMTQRTAQVAATGLDSLTYLHMAAFVDQFVEEHQLDNDLFLHQTVATEFMESLADAPAGGLAALGSLEELAVNLEQMAQVYLAYTPKTVMWQIELMVVTMMDTTRLSPLLGSVDRLAVMQTATELMEELPELVTAERRATLAEVRAITDTSLVSLLGVASAERQIILAELARLVRAERSALVEEVTQATLLALEQGRVEATALVDHTLWRIAQGGIVLILLLAIGVFVVLRRLSPRSGA